MLGKKEAYCKSQQNLLHDVSLHATAFLGEDPGTQK